jgi:hypothetical protein
MSRTIYLFVKIDLGNSGMQTSAQVAEALRKVAKRLEDNGYLENEEIQTLSRGIMDTNGNSVGEWGIG